MFEINGFKPQKENESDYLLLTRLQEPPRLFAAMKSCWHNQLGRWQHPVGKLKLTNEWRPVELQIPGVPSVPEMVEKLLHVA
jgi:hypothetical protein